MSERLVITGAAGLVGQNLVAALAGSGMDIVAIDKSAENLKLLGQLHPAITTHHADLSEPGPWQDEIAACDRLVMLHAQIGGLNPADFERNNLTATRRVMDAAERGSCRYLFHASSSTVTSSAQDFYTRSKTAQEAIVAKTRLKHTILRPTLMFGWFDRKHLGWLARFMRRMPLFPIPGDGRYPRQPLFAGDFAAIIISCLRNEHTGARNISGLERIDYGDLIRQLKQVTKAKARIVNIPYGLFKMLLTCYAQLDRNPPFTTSQLAALVTPDVFEVIDWPAIYSVRATPLREAFEKTFLDPIYSHVTLKF